MTEAKTHYVERLGWVGNETIDHAKVINERLGHDYDHFQRTLAELLEEARNRPSPIAHDDDALARGSLIKRLRDLDHRVEAVRILEGEPHLRSTNAINSFFFSIRDKIGKRNPRDRSAKPGTADILQGEINDYQEQKRINEEARLAAEREAAARIAREAAAKAAADAAAAQEAAAAVARARSAASQKAREEAAEAARQASALAAAQAAAEAERAEEARLASLARPADLVRTRGTDNNGSGVLLTSAKVPYVILVDRTKLDWAKLGPHFTDDEIEKAARRWARTTDHKVQMAGLEIGHSNKGVTR